MATTWTITNNTTGTGFRIVVANSANPAFLHYFYWSILGGSQQIAQRQGNGNIDVTSTVGAHAISALLNTGTVFEGPIQFEVTDASAVATGGYCSAADVVSVLSQFAVDRRVDDDFSGSVNTDETGFITDAILRATAWVNQFLGSRYDAATLAANTWVRWATTYLAACELERRRGNPVAASLLAEAQSYIDRLNAIQTGAALLIGDDGPEAERFGSTPAVVNLTMDLRYHFGKARSVPSISNNRRSPALPHEAPDSDGWGYL